jgi:hypothetical protein
LLCCLPPRLNGVADGAGGGGGGVCMRTHTHLNSIPIPTRRRSPQLHPHTHTQAMPYHTTRGQTNKVSPFWASRTVWEITVAKNGSVLGSFGYSSHAQCAATLSSRTMTQAGRGRARAKCWDGRMERWGTVMQYEPVEYVSQPTWTLGNGRVSGEVVRTGSLPAISARRGDLDCFVFPG